VLHPAGDRLGLLSESPEDVAADGTADGSAGILGDEEAVEPAVRLAFAG
jgi:hypothetical protein